MNDYKTQGMQDVELPFTLKAPSFKDKASDQVGGITGPVQWGILSKLANNPDENAILVSLCPISANDLNINSVAQSIQTSANGSLILDDSDNKGWFLAGCNIEIDVSMIDGKKEQSLVLQQHSPPTTEYSGSKSSSLSFNASMFGDVPTVGGAFSTSFSTTLNDVGITDSSNDKSLRTTMYMGKSNSNTFEPNGGFLSWQDIETRSEDELGDDFKCLIESGFFNDLDDNVDVSGIPPACYSNMSLLSQGIWALPQSYSGKVSISLKYCLVFGAVHSNSSSKAWWAAGLLAGGLYKLLRKKGVGEAKRIILSQKIVIDLTEASKKASHSELASSDNY
ncbi:hypothetical protein [Vibrio splendidus]|uniref:hypothetical protein n=1 Tax=Vibrio splendidus TaxID=29497 RepID=UPI003D1106A7